MSFTVGSIAAKDSAGAAIGGGLLAADIAGGGVGPFFLFNGLVDGVAGSNKAAVTAGNALKVDGSAATQPVSNAGTFVVQNNAATPAGTNLMGKVGIDQTTPGTTNKVSIGTDGTVAINAAVPAGTNLIGKMGIDQTTPGTTNGVVINNANGNGSALVANSAPVTQAPTSFRVAVTATVTASAYTAGNVLGGILTFANALLGTPTVTPTKWSAVLESICVKFKAAAVTGEIDVAIFTANPSSGTYTDKTGPTANAADQAKLVGIYSLPTPMSTLGTMTCYNLDGIGAAIDGASTSLFAVVTVKGTPTPASTSDVVVELGVLQG